ncbi:MAG TPA: HEAT repeat domain-containing protein [Candidatus Sulfotelmatobacter sp.]|nr:HEAT repeat domain-containing protein [Candidatus Sulfotelmatobacter sp.]
MKAAEPNRSCAEIAELLMFYVCEEVDEQERAAVEEHVAGCMACRTQLAEEREFSKAISSLPHAGDQLDAAGIVLAQCRSELAEKLDDLERPAVKAKATALGWLRGWMVLHPAWSAATLMALGLVGGMQYAQWASTRSSGLPQDQVLNVRPSAQYTDDQLSKMAVAGINFSPSPDSGTKTVRVRLNAEQPIELDGNLDDSNVRSVLTFVVKNGDRFDSGMRLDCLDALKARAEDSEVRAALLTAARKDQNPAVRLKALEALRDAGMDSTVRQVLLDALQHDSNPGVRVEAVNMLVRSLEQAPSESLMPPPVNPPAAPGMMQAGGTSGPATQGSIENVIQELDNLQHNDPSRYVRLRSAAALREINARSDQ